MLLRSRPGAFDDEKERDDRIDPIGRATRRRRYVLGVFLLLLLFFYFTFDPVSFQHPAHSDHTHQSSEDLAQSAWKSLEAHVSLLDVPRITRDEFLHRQSVLAATLDAAGFDAFVAEPSASTAYYANISSAYELSERPFLVMIDRHGRFSYLAPTFELGRIAGLEMVHDSKTIVQWDEGESPYAAFKSHTGFKNVVLDEHLRYMITSGLQDQGIKVSPMSNEIQSLRSVKSPAEVDILRGINEFTVQLVRSLQPHIAIGMTQETIVEAAKSLFSRAGVGFGFWAIVLFGADAAQPHGGSSGQTLRDAEFVLIDIGSKLHDYGSDVTRTILPSSSTVSEVSMKIWRTVFDAQSAAVASMTRNTTCANVDRAARRVIEEAGFAPFFTHRLGHGLGLEMHEHPYLNGANREKLRIGNVVTNEPGVYITREQAEKMGMKDGVGVRIEDAVLVTEHGGVVLTRSRAISPYHP